MPNLNKVKKCSHCGEILQTANPNQPGYIDKDTLERYPDGVLLCNECYRLEKVKLPQEAILEDDFKKILEQIKIRKSLVVYVVDLFSFEGSFISKVNEMLQGCDVLAIGNKRDLLPSTVDDKELLEYVSHRLRVAHLAVRDVVLTSSATGYNIDLMYEKIKALSDNKDVYFVGSTVSGKSALIAEFLKKYKNNTQELIITYTFPGTSLRGFKIPMGRNTYIYETPGLSINNSMLSKVELLVGHAIIPTSTIYKRSFKMGLGMSLMFGGLTLIELLKGEETKIDVYAKYSVELKCAKNGEAHFGSILTRHTLEPCSAKLKSYADFDVYDLEITEEGHRDLGILGLGWIHFIGKTQLFRVFVPKGVYVYTTRSKIKNVE